jgi:sugar phosphate isomerase/epimerase
MPKILLSTASLYTYSLKEVFSIAKQTEFDGLELVVSSKFLNGDFSNVKDLTNSYNLPIYSVHEPLFLFYRKLGVENSLKLTFNVANYLKCDSITLHIPPLLKPNNSHPWWDSYSKKFLKVVLNNDIKPLIALETVFDRKFNLCKKYFANPDVLMNYTLKHNLFITFDTTHHGLRSYSIEKTFDILKSRIINIHISNTKRRKHELPYLGKIPLKKFLKLISNSNYRNLLTLEISPFALNFWNKKRVKERLKRSINFCKENIY